MWDGVQNDMTLWRILLECIILNFPRKIVVLISSKSFITKVRILKPRGAKWLCKALNVSRWNGTSDLNLSFLTATLLLFPLFHTPLLSKSWCYKFPSGNPCKNTVFTKWWIRAWYFHFYFQCLGVFREVKCLVSLTRNMTVSSLSTYENQGESSFVGLPKFISKFGPSL